ncbi:MAG: recombinase family protein [Actinomycetota bacterium]
MAEALDRLSRDQEHIAGLYKHLQFAGVRLITKAEGEINELHVGLKGTMNALFIKDLSLKTRRGLEGRVENGKSAGGICYGYDVVIAMAENGLVRRGDRAMTPEQAAIVLRIFEEFAAGRSPRAIAFDLNREGIPAPRGENGWSPSTGVAAPASSITSSTSA